MSLFLTDYNLCSTMAIMGFRTVSVVRELLFFIVFKVIIYWGMNKIEYGVGGVDHL